jgi:hypothetical protein
MCTAKRIIEGMNRSRHILHITREHTRLVTASLDHTAALAYPRRLPEGEHAT